MVSCLLQPQYLSLEQLCQEFAVELLGMCRNQSEVTTILNSCGDESQSSLEEQAFEEGIPNLSRLRLAVNYNQKQVVRCRNSCQPEMIKTRNILDPQFLSPSLCVCFCVVCGAPNLPAGTFINLVRDPGRLERQQDGLEAVCLCGDLSHHAPPLPHLLDRAKVKGHNAQKYFLVNCDSWVVF